MHRLFKGLTCMARDLLITSLVYKNQATSSLISRPLFTDYGPVKAVFCIFPNKLFRA